MHRTTRHPATVPCLSLLAAFLFLPAGAAPAATLNWSNPAGGNATNPANWSPSQAPTAADLLNFDTPGFYGIYFAPSIPGATGLRFRSGDMGLQFGGTFTVGANGIRLADLVADSVAAGLTGGTLICNAPVAIGEAGWGKFSLAVGSFLSVPAPHDVAVGVNGSTARGFLQVGSIGQEGHLLAGDDFIVGMTAFSQGTVTVRGPGSDLIVAGDALIGQAGRGDLIVETDGLFACQHDMWVASSSTADNSTFTVGMATSSGRSWGIVDGTLRVGPVSTAPATLNIRRNGNLAVNTALEIGGAFDGSNATLHLDAGLPGAQLDVAALKLWGGSNLDFDGGTISIYGGSLDTDGVPFVLGRTGGSATLGPILSFQAGATATFPNGGATPSLRVGVPGYGEVRVEGGSIVSLDGSLTLGDGAGARGVLHVTGGGQFTASLGGFANQFPKTGAAEIHVASGGVATIGVLELGKNAGTTGQITVDGAGSLLACGTLAVGRPGLATTNATLDVSNDALATASFLSVPRGGAVNVATDGRITVDQFVVLDGTLHLDDGRVTSDSVLVRTTGALSGVGFAVGGPVRNDGVVSPGASAGLLAVSSYSQSGGGKLTIELGTHERGEWDVLRIADGATLGGTLDLRTLPSFAADPGDLFAILAFQSATGQFDNVTLNGGPLSGMTLVQGPNSISVQITGATGVAEIAAGPRPLALAARRTPDGASFDLDLPSAADVGLTLFDVAGREVLALHDGRLGAGRHAFALPRHAGVGSGVYFARALVRGEEGAESRTARVVLVR